MAALAAPDPVRVYSCARCGKRLRAGRWLFSQSTRLRYCVDIDACGRRARRKR